MVWTTLLAAALFSGAAAPDFAPPEPRLFFAAPFDSVASVEFLPVVEVNLAAERAWRVGLDWPTRPLDVALHAIGPLDEQQLQIRVDRPGEGATTAHISIVRYGFLDDSVAGTRDDFDLRFQLDGTWRVRAHQRSHACWRGPETRVWRIEPCP